VEYYSNNHDGESMLNIKTQCLTVALCLLPVCGMAEDNGNRYNRDRQYLSEISASDAYLQASRSHHQRKKEHGRHHHSTATIIDVRTRREYAAGHPEMAFNVPYPRIDTGYNQDPTTFYWEVYKNIAKGNTDRVLFTLCRTGSRSIDAGNVLADPANTALDSRRTTVLADPVLGEPVPFTNVRNIWEGFVGRELFAFENGLPNPAIKLDLNNDGVINADTADVYAHTKDANPDKDGWRNFRNLPWTTKIRKSLSYLHDKEQYECWQNDVGCP
jgi:rhodanese-related sulfurtransferase